MKPESTEMPFAKGAEGEQRFFEKNTAQGSANSIVPCVIKVQLTDKMTRAYDTSEPEDVKRLQTDIEKIKVKIMLNAYKTALNAATRGGAVDKALLALQEKERELTSKQVTSTPNTSSTAPNITSSTSYPSSSQVPGPAPTESWENLRIFAQSLKPRIGGELPHPPVTHLRQRLGDVQRGERPSVATRRISDQTRVAISEDNYLAALKKAGEIPWKSIIEEQTTKLETLVKSTGDLPPMSAALKYPTELPKYGDDTTLFDLVKLAPAVEKKRNPESYKGAFGDAWKGIRAAVEAEVLDQVGLPDAIIIVPDGDKTLDGLPAYYEAKTKKVCFAESKAESDRIMHEFGHHIEEQGPVEIWLGLASLLNLFSGQRPLNAPQALYSRQPSYGIDDDETLRGLVGGGSYAASYYPDAGTELLALALEKRLTNGWELLLEDVGKGQWADPRLLLLLLHAFRPKEMRERGFSYPTLL
jgi:hypothetical protein